MPPHRRTDADDPILERLEDARDGQARADTVLQALATHYAAVGACLFGVTESGLRAIATRGRLQVDELLRAQVEAYLSAELASSATVTVTVHDERAASGGADVWSIGDRDVLFPSLLQGKQEGQSLITGVALLRLPQCGLPLPLSPALLQALGQALLLDDRVTGVRPAS